MRWLTYLPIVVCSIFGLAITLAKWRQLRRPVLPDDSTLAILRRCIDVQDFDAATEHGMNDTRPGSRLVAVAARCASRPGECQRANGGDRGLTGRRRRVRSWRAGPVDDPWPAAWFTGHRRGNRGRVQPACRVRRHGNRSAAGRRHRDRAVHHYRRHLRRHSCAGVSPLPVVDRRPAHRRARGIQSLCTRPREG